MTAADAMELVNMYSDSAITTFTIHLTLTFAYLAAGYLAAHKLTFPQIASLSALYIAGTGSCILCMYINIAAWGSVFEYATPLHNTALWNPDFWLWYMTSLELAGVIIGLFFVLKIRHPNTE
jgi:hypothetical protein